jgi:2-C-methyl-D-erythritol 4-phosphate cytidylyltransferase
VAQVWSIVVAGGSGRRFGRPKQYAVLAGRPVVAWAVEACRPWSTGVVLVVPPGGDQHDQHELHGADTVVSGGLTRADSVRRGLAAVPPDAEVIVVHDAARPLASAALFRSVIDAVGKEGGADGAVPGLPVGDTIKVVDEARIVTRTLDRASLVAVQTPQAFRAEILRRAHEADAGAESSPAATTDDAMMVEALGGTVRVVDGDAGNLKLTTPGDLETAAALLAARGA